MNTNRFNVFNQIHKGLRALLFDTVMQIQQTDMSNAEAAAPVLEQTELLLHLFDSHAYHEDTCILSAAEQHSPQVIKDFESEHETDLALSNSLRQKVTDYRLGQSDAARYVAGYNLYYALNDFVAFNLKHMNKEEQLLNTILWTNYTDAEILGMEHQIQQQIEPEKMLTYFKWMIKGINNTELIIWLNAVKAHAPDFVFNALLETCQQNLPQDRWAVVEQQISEGAAI
ncbi:hemerythrin domain-containing protein [Mucilaginibacter litoreus]|uniref:Hemerythrin domain-containing protein n=1 Tax=Mucilaginibacter litoreus TaxID=1048221 RepID=A0ABW3AR31_9SPHI